MLVRYRDRYLYRYRDRYRPVPNPCVLSTPLDLSSMGDKRDACPT